MLNQLTCENLHEIDKGIAGEVINAELRKAISDLQDRGEHDGKVRTVSIKIELAKYKGVDLINITAKADMPARRTGSTHAECRFIPAKEEGRPPVAAMFFQTLNPERVDQPTFPVMDKEGGEVENE